MSLQDALSLGKRRGGHDYPVLVCSEPGSSTRVECLALLALTGFRGASKPLTSPYSLCTLSSHLCLPPLAVVHLVSFRVTIGAFQPTFLALQPFRVFPFLSLSHVLHPNGRLCGASRGFFSHPLPCGSGT